MSIRFSGKCNRNDKVMQWINEDCICMDRSGNGHGYVHQQHFCILAVGHNLYAVGIPDAYTVPLVQRMSVDGKVTFDHKGIHAISFLPDIVSGTESFIHPAHMEPCILV